MALEKELAALQKRQRELRIKPRRGRRVSLELLGDGGIDLGPDVAKTLLELMILGRNYDELQDSAGELEGQVEHYRDTAEYLDAYRAKVSRLIDEFRAVPDDESLTKQTILNALLRIQDPEHQSASSVLLADEDCYCQTCFQVHGKIKLKKRNKDKKKKNKKREQ